MSRSAWRAVQWVLIAIIIAFVVRRVANQWDELTALPASLTASPSLLLASAAAVLASYAVLIWTWQRTVVAWGERLAFSDAARIWFVSNLGRYVPGKVWQIGAMGVMAERAGVSPVAAVGSSLVIAIVNVIAGIAIAVPLGAGQALGSDLLLPVAAGLGIAVLAAPWLLPVAVRTAARVLRRDIRVPALPHRAVWIAGVGCAVAWLLYGVAFRCLHIALMGRATGDLGGSTAAFTASYLVGFLALFAPGGIGVREWALGPLLEQFGIAAGAEATLIVLASRLWLTIIEILPGLAFLLMRRPGNASHSRPAA
jgi:hypothetical protein